MTNKFTIGLVQMRSTTNAEENLVRACEKIREAAKRGAQIVCMDELFRGEYFCRKEDAGLFNLAEPFPGPTTDVLTKVAQENKVAIVASLFERRAAGLYHNTCAVIDADGGFLGKYRKMHIPDDPLYYEKFYFTPGDLGFPTFDTKYGRIGVQICWDQWYPEGSRLCAGRGAGDFLSHQHRMASGRESGVRRGAARGLEDHPARARDRQRRVCRGGEPRGI